MARNDGDIGEIHDPELFGETLIFLDVDGVLNVGIPDPGGAVSCNKANMLAARRYLKKGVKNDLPERFLGVMRMQTTSDNAGPTFGDFLARSDIDICDVFVHRLVKILRAVGRKRRVILSSSWRMTKSSRRREKLEYIIGGYLRERFRFDDTTALEYEAGGHDRLRLIGDYIKTYCSRMQNKTTAHVLVLDDFYYLPIQDFICGDTQINSLRAAEAYLEGCAPSTITASVRIIHTYKSVSLPSGMNVRIGTGMIQQHLADALEFVGTSPSFVDDATSPCRHHAPDVFADVSNVPTPAWRAPSKEANGPHALIQDDDSTRPSLSSSSSLAADDGRGINSVNDSASRLTDFAHPLAAPAAQRGHTAAASRGAVARAAWMFTLPMSWAPPAYCRGCFVAALAKAGASASACAVWMLQVSRTPLSHCHGWLHRVTC